MANNTEGPTNSRFHATMIDIIRRRLGHLDEDLANRLAEAWQAICCNKFTEKDFEIITDLQAKLYKVYSTYKPECKRFIDDIVCKKEAERYMAFLFAMKVLENVASGILQPLSRRQLKLLLLVGLDDMIKYDAYLEYNDRTRGKPESVESKHLEDYTNAKRRLEQKFGSLIPNEEKHEIAYSRTLS